MKTAKLGDFLLWEGKVAQIRWETDQRTVGIVILEPNLCPHCGGMLENKAFDVIPTSPMFQENAKPIKTIDGH